MRDTPITTKVIASPYFKPVKEYAMARIIGA